MTRWFGRARPGQAMSAGHPPGTELAEELGRLGRYVLVGITAVSVHAGVAFTLLLTAGVPPTVSHLVGFFAGFIVSGIGHAKFTFRGQSALGPTLARFFLVALAALVISEIALLALLAGAGWTPTAAQAAAIVVSAGFSYILSRNWAFR